MWQAILSGAVVFGLIVFGEIRFKCALGEKVLGYIHGAEGAVHAAEAFAAQASGRVTKLRQALTGK